MSPPDTIMPPESVVELIDFARSPRGIAAGMGAAIGGADVPGELYRLMLQDALARLRAAERTITDQRDRIDYLETLSLTDELTGLANRRGFLDGFRRELAAAKRGAMGGVLVLVDLDGFKAINDRLGHLAGDHYLRQVGRALLENVRGHDMVARLGGDEFAVLLTRTESVPGLARASALERAVAARHCDWQREKLPLTASFGAVPFTADDREDEVIRRADARMYRDKAARKRRQNLR